MSAQLYSAAEIMPEKKDIERIIIAKMSYDKAKQEKTPQDFDTWINDRKNYFQVAPRGIAYTVSQKNYRSYVNRCRQKNWKAPKSYAPMSLRFYIIAIAIGWTDLIQELKVILRYWGFTSDDLKQYAKDVWQVPANMDTICQLISQAQQQIDPKALHEAIEKHATLNSKLFTKEEILKETVRKKMLEIVDEFLNNLKEQNIEIKVDDILMVGSNANYNYTKDSDIDLHVIANTKNMKYEMEIANALYSAYRTLFNKNLDINLYDIPLELYVEVENTPRNSNGVYSVKKDKWVKKPVQEEIPTFDKEALDKLVDKWEKKCKDLLDKITADKLDDEKQVVKLIEDIYEKLRKTGIAKSEYAIENLAFKELRNKGYLDKLKLAKHELISKRLSLEEKLENKNNFKKQDHILKIAGVYQAQFTSNNVFIISNIKEHDFKAIYNNLLKLDFIKGLTYVEQSYFDPRTLSYNVMPSKQYKIKGSIK